MWIACALALAAVAADGPEGPVEVVDGDTLIVGGVKVRLQGIDAPEWDQTCWNGDGQPWPCGRRVAQALEGALRGAEASCLRLDTDRYGRVVGRCFVGPHDVGALVVRAGGAVAYTRYSVDYVDDEAVARAHLRGLWGGPFDPPEEWRRLDDDEIEARVRRVEAALARDPSGRSVPPLN